MEANHIFTIVTHLLFFLLQPENSKFLEKNKKLQFWDFPEVSCGRMVNKQKLEVKILENLEKIQLNMVKFLAFSAHFQIKYADYKNSSFTYCQKKEHIRNSAV